MEDNNNDETIPESLSPNEITKLRSIGLPVQLFGEDNTARLQRLSMSLPTILSLAQPQNTTSSVVITYSGLEDAVRAGQVGSAVALKLIITSLQRINDRPRQPLCLNFVDIGLTAILGEDIVFYGALTAQPNSLCEVLTRDYVMAFRGPSKRGPLIKIIRHHFKLLEGGAIEVDEGVLNRSIQLIEEFENGQDAARVAARKRFTEVMASLDVDDILAQVLAPGVEEGETTENEEEGQEVIEVIELLGSSGSSSSSGSDGEDEEGDSAGSEDEKEEKEGEDDDAADALPIDNDNDQEGVVDALGGINNDISNNNNFPDNNNNGVNHLLSYLDSSSSEEVYSSGSEDDNDQSQSSGSKRRVLGELMNRDSTNNNSHQGKEDRVETEEKEKEGEDEAAAALPNNNQEKVLDSCFNGIPNNNNVSKSTANDNTLDTTTIENPDKWNRKGRKVCFDNVEEAKSPHSSKKKGKESKDDEVAEEEAQVPLEESNAALEVDTNEEEPPVEAEKEGQEPSVEIDEGQVYPVDTRVAKIFEDPANNGIRRLYQGRVVSYNRRRKVYKIRYEDKDWEEMDVMDVREHLVVELPLNDGVDDENDNTGAMRFDPIVKVQFFQRYLTKELVYQEGEGLAVDEEKVEENDTA